MISYLSRNESRLTIIIIFYKLVLCAIPVFIKLPGAATLDLGGRTEGRVLNNVYDTVA